MSTPNRTEINQANAQRSTGPKTPEGKKISPLNALRHGLTGQMIVMPTEDLAAYQSHLKSFTDEYSPKGATESHLVQALADTSWRLNRVAALLLETNLLSSYRCLGARSHHRRRIHGRSDRNPLQSLVQILSMHSQRSPRASLNGQSQSASATQIIRHIEEKHDLEQGGGHHRDV